MIENRPPWSWTAGVIAAVGINFVLLIPTMFAFRSFVSGDLGWAIAVDSFWDQGFMPIRDYSYFYGLLTLIVDRGIFALLGRGPHAQGVLYFLFNAAITFGLLRFVAAAKLGRHARTLALIAAPIVVMPVTFPSPTHGLEPALLVNAIALQAAGHYSWALALVTACLFVKPSMALVYGAILTGLILFSPNRNKLLQFLPAAGVGLTIAITLAAVFGANSLLESLLPTAGMKVYADERFGFFFGVGQRFWLDESLDPRYYIFTPAGFWLLATAVLIPGGIRAAIWGRGPLAATTATCTAMHVMFFCFMFGNHMSWFYYSYALVIGLCGVLDRSGLPVRIQPVNRAERFIRSSLLVLAGSAQVGTVIFGLYFWSTAVRTEATNGLFDSASNEVAWKEMRQIAKHERVFFLAPAGAGHEFMPEVESVRSWFLIRAVTTEPEIEAVRLQIRNADWVIIPLDFDTHLHRWPEITDELQRGRFQLVKQFNVLLFLKRTAPR